LLLLFLPGAAGWLRVAATTAVLSLQHRVQCRRSRCFITASIAVFHSTVFVCVHHQVL